MDRSTCNLPGCLRLAEKVYVTTRAGRWSMVEVRYPRCTDHPLKSYAKTEPLPPQPDAEPLDHHQMAYRIGAGCEDDVPHGDLCDAFLSLYKGQPEAEPVEGELKAAYFEGWRHGLNAVVDIDPDTGQIADSNPNDSWPRSRTKARIQPRRVSEADWSRAVQEAALGLMQMRGGPGVPRTEEAIVALAAGARILGIEVTPTEEDDA